LSELSVYICTDVDSPDPPTDDKANVKLKSKSIPTFQKVKCLNTRYE